MADFDEDLIKATAKSVLARVSHGRYRDAAEKLIADAEDDETVFHCLYVVCLTAANVARERLCRCAPLPAETPIGARLFHVVDGQLVDRPIDDTDPGVRAAIRFFNATAAEDGETAWAVAETVQTATREHGAGTINGFLQPLFAMVANIVPPHPDGPTGADQ